jgi:predicted nuclease of predicted toxin-antitoxin system
LIIIDENIDQLLVDELSDYSFSLMLIRQKYPEIDDEQILKIAQARNAIIITEDKDFGKLVFADNLHGCSIILLRYNNPDISPIMGNLLKVLNYYKTHSEHFFTTITAKKIRMRKI